MKRQFDEALSERKKDVIELKASDFFVDGGLAKKIVRKDGQLEPYNAQDSVLESQFRSVTSEYPPRQYIPEPAPLYNVKINVNRTIYPVSRYAESIGRFEIGLSYKKSEGFADYNTRRDPVSMANRPMHIPNPVRWNELMCENQLLEIRQDPEKYFRKTPWDYWKDFTVDGVLAHIRGLEDGFSKSIEGPEELKRATFSTKGENFIHNYWAKSNPRPQHYCYMVVKKYDMPTEYVFDSKDTGSSRKSPSDATLAERYRGKFRPFQIGFFTMPHRGIPPRSIKRYRDEYDMKHYDGLVIYIGKVLTSPRTAVSSYYNTNNTDYKLINEPYVDWNVGIDGNQSTMMKIILDPNDGIPPVQ
jgi:hypothetical protein